MPKVNKPKPEDFSRAFDTVIGQIRDDPSYRAAWRIAISNEVKHCLRMSMTAVVDEAAESAADAFLDVLVEKLKRRRRAV
jgi:hypothetical protein